MARTVISVEHLTKQYDLGLISSGTLARDLSRWWARVRGKEDPFTRVDNTNPFLNNPGESILALDDVSFKVEEGQALGIIGRNGAGKSTLLKILSRVTAPTSGVVKIKGRIGSLLEVGTGFHPELTGRENVFLNGAILGMSKAEVQRKFDEIVDFSGVEKFIDTPVKRYSSGMYVRLAFAVAAHLDPEILIVDEVLAVGDAEFQKKCLGKMGDVAGEGRTVLFVSHNMNAIQTLCDDAILLIQGKFGDSGKSEEVIDKYLSLLQEKAEICINDRDDRFGDGTIRFTGCRWINENDMEVKTLKTGEVYKLELQYACQPGEYFDVIFDFSINYRGSRIITCSNYATNQVINKLSQNGRVHCLLPKLPLPSGSYTINLHCRSAGLVTDHIDDAITFDVEKGDYYKTSEFYPENPGVLFIDHTWEIDN